MKIIDTARACCFTGHRMLSRKCAEELRKLLSIELENYYNDGYRDFICGGAIGFDTVAALSVIAARARHNDIRLILILPCGNQTMKWRETDKIVYGRIYKAADEVITLHDNFTAECMLERNRIMLENSTACIAYHDGRKRGGTYYTYAMSQKLGRRCVNLHDKMKLGADS